jgi:hypothetical protein
MAWLCFNDAFLSVVNYRSDQGLLVVRARRAEHLRNIFGSDAEITVTRDRDYKYRTVADRKAVAEIIASRIESINYGNFKDSVKSDRLHDLYAEFWMLHRGYQD